MKTFLFAVILFALMLSFITYNYIYIRSASEELSGIAESLDINDTEKLSELIAIWEEKHPFISLSTEESKEQSIEDLLSSLSVYSKNQNTDEFEHTKALLVNAFRALAAFETFSLHDIF